MKDVEILNKRQNKNLVKYPFQYPPFMIKKKEGFTQL